MTEPEPLSTAQEALWFIHHVVPDSAAYNIAYALRLRGELDEAVLSQAARAIGARHELLHSLFAATDRGPRRIVGSPELFRLRSVEVEPADDLPALVREEVARPFDLSRTGPARLTLFRRGPAESVLVLVAHHISTDFISEATILRELLDGYATLLAGREPEWEPVTGTYADFVAAERELLESPRAAELAEFWRTTCAGAPVSLDLPVDRPRTGAQRLVGASHVFHLPPDVVKALVPAARACGVMPLKYLFGMFQALLHRYSGQPDFLIGCVADTRPRTARQAIGPFVNSIPVRARPGSDATFRSMVVEANARIAQGMAHVDYPFALLTRALDRSPEPGGQPLLQVMVSLMSINPAEPLLALAAGEDGFEIDYAGLRVSGFEVPQQEGQFDLTLELTRSAASVRGVLKYDTDLFDQGTIERLGRHFVALIRAAIADPDQPVSAFSLVDPDERARLLAFSNLS
ncbi:condensation domain-containing protein [Amycolatopsis magusensis]|uniref:condensation domain-containing protein n=1 Tax=Amycolatopsis magusensis TaxID=882444 RepID=UPI00378C1BF5